jgi:LPXTG-motif cell wall-anchored protein
MLAQRRSRTARQLAAALCAALLALSAVAAPAALAGPANEYKLRGVPNGGVGDPGGGSGTTVLLIAGVVILAGVGALVYVKRRGKTKEAT